MIADSQHVRKVGSLPTSLEEDYILPHLRSARRRLRSWVGETVYDAAETEVGNDWGSPADFTSDGSYAEATIALADAEAYLTIYYGLPSWNTVLAGDGGVSMSGQVGEDTTYRYMTPYEEVKKRPQYLEMAEERIAGYIDDASGGSPGPAISRAYSDDDTAIT